MVRAGLLMLLHNWGLFILEMRQLWRPLTVCPLLLIPIATGDHWGDGAMVSTTGHGRQGNMAQVEMRCSYWIWGNTFPPQGQWGSGTGCPEWLHSLHPLEVFKIWQEKCPSTWFELMDECTFSRRLVQTTAEMPSDLNNSWFLWSSRYNYSLAWCFPEKKYISKGFL